MSITDLADACHVGDTSVYRFCRTLKLDGYQDFKMKLSFKSQPTDGVLPGSFCTGQRYNGKQSDGISYQCNQRVLFSP